MFRYGGIWLGILIPLAAVIGAFATAIVQAMARARVRELEIRERIAMIERGLVPSPESDPRKFDEVMSRFDRYAAARDAVAGESWMGRRSSGRYRRAGVIMMGVGVGLMFLIGLESPREGLGVGLFIACMGIAFFLSSFVDGHSPDARPYPPAGTPPADQTKPAGH
jgi:Domain of unknown function (DUF6249)